jgi:hypothetical protein
MPPEAVRFSGCPVALQATQAGTGKVVEPRAINSVTSRPIAGGAPVIRAWRSAASARARLRSIAGLTATASTAALTSEAGNDVPAAVTWAIT